VSKRPLNALVLTAALVIGAGPFVGPYVVRAAGLNGNSAADTSPIANVDMQRLYEESEARVQAENRVRAFSAKVYQNFEETAKLQFITPEETEDFSRAINAEKPADADTKKLASIRNLNKSRADEYQTLAAKPQTSVTAQDKARLRELTTMTQQRPVILDRLQKFYQEAVDEEASKRRRAGFAEVRAAVQKLAKEQSFTQVYDVTAMVYAPNDITEQALKRVRAKNPIKG
jgi:Skp family chaperone for outer membrane proteins